VNHFESVFAVAFVRVLRLEVPEVRTTEVGIIGGVALSSMKNPQKSINTATRINASLFIPRVSHIVSRDFPNNPAIIPRVI